MLFSASRDTLVLGVVVVPRYGVRIFYFTFLLSLLETAYHLLVPWRSFLHQPSTGHSTRTRHVGRRWHHSARRTDVGFFAFTFSTFQATPSATLLGRLTVTDPVDRHSTTVGTNIARFSHRISFIPDPDHRLSGVAPYRHPKQFLQHAIVSVFHTIKYRVVVL